MEKAWCLLAVVCGIACFPCCSLGLLPMQGTFMVVRDVPDFVQLAASGENASSTLGGPSHSPCTFKRQVEKGCIVFSDGDGLGIPRRCTLKERLLESYKKEMVEAQLRGFGWTHAAMRWNSSCWPDLLWLRLPLDAIEHADLPLAWYGDACNAGSYVNRIPGAEMHLNNKHGIALNFKRSGLHGHPTSFTYPEEWPQAVQLDRELDHDEINWIIKPICGGRGIGIRVAKTLRGNGDDDDSPDHLKGHLIQRYIRPNLIQGRKWTTRSYCIITSLDPPRVYFHRNGVVKFSYQPYEENPSMDVAQHITNFAAPRHVSNYPPGEESSVEIGVGENQTIPRWNFYGLRNWCSENTDKCPGYHVLRERQKSVLSNALHGAFPELISMSNELGIPLDGACTFQLLGVDIDFSSNWTPYFIEANVNPSMGAKVPFELLDKEELVKDTLHVLQTGSPLGTGWEYLPFEEIVDASDDGVGADASLSGNHFFAQ